MSVLKLALSIAAFAASVSPDAAPASQPPANQAAVYLLDAFVAELRRQIPKDFGEGIVMVEARREDNVAIVVVQVSREVADEVSAQEFGGWIAKGFCQRGAPEAFFAGGNRLRFDMRVSGGETVRGDPIDRCPG